MLLYMYCMFDQKINRCALFSRTCFRLHLFIGFYFEKFKKGGGTMSKILQKGMVEHISCGQIGTKYIILILTTVYNLIYIDRC